MTCHSKDAISAHRKPRGRDSPPQDLRGDQFEELNQFVSLLRQDRPQSVAFPARSDLWVSLRVGQGRLNCDGPAPFARPTGLSILHHNSSSLASPDDPTQDPEYPHKGSDYQGLEMNFRECPKGGLRRISIPRTRVNRKGEAGR